MPVSLSRLWLPLPINTATTWNIKKCLFGIRKLRINQTCKPQLWPYCVVPAGSSDLMWQMGLAKATLASVGHSGIFDSASIAGD